MLRKSSFFILTFLLLEMTSCSFPKRSSLGDVVIPCTWQSSIKEGMTLENPSCFLWWEELNDPLLTSFIIEAANRNRDVLIANLKSKYALLKTMNDVSAEIAKNYIEFRGLQLRLKNLNENFAAQNEILTQNKDLSNSGFFGVTKENEDQISLESFLMQRALILFSMDKITFHLSTLLNYSPGILGEILCQI
jgi:outer membrane protein TolC